MGLRSALQTWWRNPKPIFFPKRWTHTSSSTQDHLQGARIKPTDLRLSYWLSLGVIIGLLAGAIVAITIATGGAAVPVIFSGLASNPYVATTLYALLWAFGVGIAVPGLLSVMACWRDRPQIVDGKATGRWRYWRNLILSSLCLAPIITVMAPAVGVVSGFSAFGWMATHLPMLSVPGWSVFGSQMLSVGLWFGAALVGGQTVSACFTALAANRAAKKQFRASAALRFTAYFFSVGVIGGLLVFVTGLGAVIAGYIKAWFPTLAEEAFGSKVLGDAFAASAAGPSIASLVVGAIVSFFMVRFGMDYVDQDEEVLQSDQACSHAANALDHKNQDRLKGIKCFIQDQVVTRGVDRSGSRESILKLFVESERVDEKGQLQYTQAYKDSKLPDEFDRMDYDAGKVISALYDLMESKDRFLSKQQRDQASDFKQSLNEAMSPPASTTQSHSSSTSPSQSSPQQ